MAIPIVREKPGIRVIRQILGTVGCMNKYQAEKILELYGERNPDVTVDAMIRHGELLTSQGGIIVPTPKTEPNHEMIKCLWVAVMSLADIKEGSIFRMNPPFNLTYINGKTEEDGRTRYLKNTEIIYVFKNKDYQILDTIREKNERRILKSTKYTKTFLDDINLIVVTSFEEEVERLADIMDDLKIKGQIAVVPECEGIPDISLYEID